VKTKLQTHDQGYVTEPVENVNIALQKMVDVLDSKSKSQNHGLDKLSVPIWDGDRKSYATSKNEFNNCITIKTKTSNYNDYAKRFQSTFFGRIK
jgi:hypothetical protein